jgi:hypothetical protein
MGQSPVPPGSEAFTEEAGGRRQEAASKRLTAVKANTVVIDLLLMVFPLIFVPLRR